jgi:hypothetical protein
LNSSIFNKSLYNICYKKQITIKELEREKGRYEAELERQRSAMAKLTKEKAELTVCLTILHFLYLFILAFSGCVVKMLQ